MKCNGELLIWASDGVWYQYRDPDTRQIKTSFLGVCDSYEGVHDFAEAHGIPLEIFPSKSSSVAKRPAACAARAQRQGGEASATERDMFAMGTRR